MTFVNGIRINDYVYSVVPAENRWELVSRWGPNVRHWCHNRRKRHSKWPERSKSGNKNSVTAAVKIPCQHNLKIRQEKRRKTHRRRNREGARTPPPTFLQSNYTPCNEVRGDTGITLSVRPAVCLSVCLPVRL